MGALQGRPIKIPRCAIAHLRTGPDAPSQNDGSKISLIVQRFKARLEKRPKHAPAISIAWQSFPNISTASSDSSDEKNEVSGFQSVERHIVRPTKSGSAAVWPFRRRLGRLPFRAASWS